MLVFITYTKYEGSGEPVYMDSLTWAFSGRTHIMDTI